MKKKTTESSNKVEQSYEQKIRDEKLKAAYKKLQELEKDLQETGANDWLDFERHVRDLKAHIIARMKGQ